MGIVIKQSIGAAIYSYVGVALGVISTLFIFPHYLTPAQIGLTMGVMLPLASILSIFSMLGTSNAAYYYAAHFKNDAVHQPRFLQFLVRMLLVGIAIVVAAYIFCKPFFVENYQQKSALFIQYYWWVLPLIIFVSLYNFFEAFLKSQSDIIFANFCREVLLRLLTLACLVLFISHVFTFHNFVQGFVLIWGILFLTIIIYSYKKDWFSWSANVQFNSVASKKSIIQYSLVNVLSGAAWALASNIDSLMIAKYSGLESAGVFRLAVYICTVVQVPQRSITQIIITLLSEHWRNNALDKIQELYQKSSLQLIITGSFLVMLVVVNIDYFLQILPIEFSHSGSTKWVVILLCIARLVDMATSINGEIIQTSKQYRFNFYLIIGLLIFTIFANYLLIPKYGIIGAAIAGMLTVIFFNITKFIFVWIKFKFQPFTINSVIAIVLAAVAGLVVYFIPFILNPFVTIFCKSTIATLVFVVSLTALKISPEINQILFKAISLIRKK
jgi:O-antigen/teichoic acid export membrane protein